MTFFQACSRASINSAEGCTVHVCAVLRIVDGTPNITGYTVSDWYDGSVVCAYTNGKRHT